MPRGSSFTEEIAEVICARIENGDSLRQICETKGFPDRTTVFRWLDDRPEFATKYARARDRQADTMDDRIMQVADRCESGELDPHAAKVVIGALQWRASKLKPKVYGDRIENRLADAEGNALKITVTGILPTEENTR